ncbi:NYN domain-containing protein [Mycolicibacterium sp. BiH015]|uniref:NYN domain-containing protein n=1 Tax=Mycolicibacterium sp. BiH015 TaxID=3018808 RepID=UPI0022DEC21B|nr:NYN domain-containing protein [Mycolicibacterium sp. BiH015]MDA2892586.1 NYN domain-containing protein [Mycolicibacterium sp. BiH015]
MDYQNMHLTAHGLYDSTRYGPKHDCLLDPLGFAVNLVATRNGRQRLGHADAELASVLVYRGLPLQQYEPDSYARSLAQKAQWERDRRVSVHLRPLHYRTRYDAQGTPILDSDGNRVIAEVREKGVDVLCALALVREAASPDNDLVILASHDTDLEPALDEALRQGHAKVETCQWFRPDGQRHTKQLRPTGRSIWNTRLDESAFQRSWDRTPYS